MDKGKLIVSLIIFAIAGIKLFLSIMSFMEKGKLMNNAYIYASKEEREKMNKKPYYRQSGIAFLFTFMEFVFIGLSCLFDNVIYTVFQALVLIILFVYAIASSVKISKLEKK